MADKLWQWNFRISGLIPHQAKVRKFWLKKGKLFVEKKGNMLDVYLLGDDSRKSFDNDEEILPYLKFSSLISPNRASLEGGGGSSLVSKDEFGKKPTMGKSSFSISNPEEAIEDIEKYIPDFLEKIKTIHNKYGDTVRDNRFLEISTDFFYECRLQSVYTDEGFINAMISLEALYGDSSSPINYKVAIRAGFLLGLGGLDPMEVFRNMKTLYGIRSGLVHGTSEKGSFGNVVGEIDLYARRSIIIFLILLVKKKRNNIKSKERKTELLREIDYAMLDVSRRNALQREIISGIKTFEIKFPRWFEGKGKNGDYRIFAW